jgi:hypothetical protein
MPVVGAGRGAAEAYAPHLVTVGGVRLAVLAFSQVHALSSTWRATDTRPGIAVAFDLARTTAAVRAARAKADVVIVFTRSSCPSGEMKTFAGKMAGAGADLVVGTHAHVLLTDARKADTYVHYRLGNLSCMPAARRRACCGSPCARRTWWSGSSCPGRSRRPASRYRCRVAKQRAERKIAQAAKCTGLSGSVRR